MTYSLFISCPKGMEYLLGDELSALGLSITKTTPMGVYGEVDNLTLVYRLCLWSRIANRIQLILFNGHLLNDEQSIYRLCHQFHWQKVFTSDKTFAIEFHGKSKSIRNTMYGAQLVKDAIVDYFKRHGRRPDVDKTNPDVRLHAYLKHNELTVSLDLCGYSLHQRGYRKTPGLAPLKENVAAAVLMRSNWPSLSQQGLSLVDPFCGSGTLLIEAALIATQTAPGLLRQDQALKHWVAHVPSLWDKTRDAAKQQITPLTNRLIGFDSNPRAINLAQQSAHMAGFADDIHFKQQAINDYHPIDGQGIIVTNPPYGERLDETSALIPVYQNLGHAMSQQLSWQAFVLTTNPMLAKATGLRSHKQYQFYNGPLEAQLYCFKLDNNKQYDNIESKSSSDNQTLKNRLLKNKKHLNKWLQREDIQCYRLYDADIPEYACAIDVYDDWVHVQEYAAPRSIAQHKAEQRVLDMMKTLPQVLSVPPSQLILKQRKPQKGSNQYQSVNNKQQFLTVREGKAKFYLNLHDYLDTGLFLDHRALRRHFHETTAGKLVLNCFCYTGTFSVQAALGGAKTVNVDLSNTYLNWAKKNFKLNQLKLEEHQFIQADCLEWLKQAEQHFDVILLDPPSFSNSKRMKSTLDIQRDHVPLINSAMKLLNPKGCLYFSTNLRKFKLSPLLQGYRIKEITQKTLDEDFKRSKPSHQCFLFENKLD